MNSTSASKQHPIAIVGMACRFPGAEGPSAYWQLLRQGLNMMGEVPADRWNPDIFHDAGARMSGKVSTRRGGFLERMDTFDAQFFGISPREADRLDPQQRLMLEVAWEAMEDAGQPPEELAGTGVGVFVGFFTLDYQLVQLSPLNRHLIDTHTATGALGTMLSNRISYTFDFRGPSISLDTACSSSLVAVHLACASIWNGECEMALAGGANVQIVPDYTIAESKGGFLSPDGASKAFSARANGYARGEGAGIILLKPLADALAAGDPIYALIRGTAVNQDGHSNGITVPRQEAQEALVRQACRRAGVLPGDIQYVEAHGTGTPVGDPIEARALGTVLGAGRDAAHPCIVASAKANIGHLEAAAGIAGLIKTALCLKHREIPPHVYATELNAAIPFGSLGLRVPEKLEQWPASDGPDLACVNSFGFGGTNAHVVLEGPPDVAASHDTGGVSGDDTRVLTVSARSQDALREAAAGMRDFVRDSGQNLHDICYTAAIRRSHHDYRLAITGASAEDFVRSLDAFVAGDPAGGLSSGQRMPGDRPGIAFVFTGMGPQWWAMGRDLYHQEPVFRETMDKCHHLFHGYADWRLLDELLAEESRSRMAETEIAQVCNFALQVSTAELWRSWGCVPDAVVGHSLGEIAAAHVAGALSLEDALNVCCQRSRAQNQTAGQGLMLAVGLSAKEAKSAMAAYKSRIAIAAVNGPNSTTLSGDADAIEKLAKELQANGIFCRLLRVKIAYHSHHMDPLREQLLHSLQSIHPDVPRVPLYSTVTGELLECAPDASHWWLNVRKPVRFASAMERLFQNGFRTFLEVGPHPVLASSIAECLSARREQATTMCSLRRGEPERKTMLAALGQMHCLGYPVNWSALYPDRGTVVDLPHYPWQRERHWNESAQSLASRLAPQSHPLLGSPVPGARPAWRFELNRSALAYLDDHCVQGAVVFPGAGYIEMALAAGSQFFGQDDFAVEELRFHKALFLEGRNRPTIEVTLDPEKAAFEIHSRAGEDMPWALHASGKFRQKQDRRMPTLDPWSMRGVRDRLSKQACYASFRKLGFEYGPCFQAIDELWRSPGEVIARIVLPEPVAAGAGLYRLHPSLLDACFQALIAAAEEHMIQGGGLYLPVGVDRVRVYRPAGTRVSAVTRDVRISDSGFVGSILLLDDLGEIVAEVEGFRAQPVAASETAAVDDRSIYEVEWRPQPRANQETLQDLPGKWLILADSGGVGANLKSLLAAQGHTCVMASRDAIDPQSPGGFEKLLGSASSIVHLWALDLPDNPDISAEDLAAAQTACCTDVMHLVQALARSGRSPRLWLATQGAQPAGGASVDSVAQSCLWGMGRVIGHQEHIGAWGGLVDLDPAAASQESAMQLFQEICSPDGEDQVAFRHAERYVCRLTPGKALKPPVRLPVRPDSAYLITGGLGSLGLLTARWLVEQGARRLILMSRGGIAPRAEWHRLAPGSPAAERVGAVRALESLGATISVVPVDASDEAACAAFLKRYEEEAHPPIRGIVHSAGIVQDQLLLHMESGAFRDVIRPKTGGAWSLHRLFQNAPLDFFVMYSSVASVVASTGQANYAAANASLDAIANYRRAQGLPALSINWGPWAIGMIQKLNLVDHYARKGIQSITPAQGLAFMSRLFGQNLPQAVVVSVDWPLLLDQQAHVPQMLAELRGADGTAGDSAESQSELTFMQQLLLADSGERLQLLRSHIVDLTARVMRLDRARIDPEHPLNLIGMDSMMATELKNRVELSLQTPVSVVDLLKGASIAALSSKILTQMLADNGVLAELLSEIEGLSPVLLGAELSSADLTPVHA